MAFDKLPEDIQLDRDLVQSIPELFKRKDPVYTIQEHNGKVVTDLVFHDGLIASSDFYGKVVIFNLSTGNILYVFETGGKVTNIEFSPDGTKLIVLNADQNTAQVFSVKSGILLFSMRGNDHEISKVGFTADGNKAVALFTDGGDVYCNVFNDLDSLVKHARSILGKELSCGERVVFE